MEQQRPIAGAGSKGASHTSASSGSSVNQFRFDLGAPTMIVMAAMLTGFGVVLGLSISKLQQSDRQADARVAQIRQDFDHQAQLTRQEYDTQMQSLVAGVKDLKTQYWLVERRLMDAEALDILHGTKLVSDTEFGPTGNLQRMKPRSNQNGR